MHVIEIFLPLQRQDGTAQPSELFGKVRKELVGKFGGLTAYSRSPAEGLWEREEGSVDRDAIVIFEVMAETLNRAWWSQYRAQLEKMFEQDAVVIRSTEVEAL